MSKAYITAVVSAAGSGSRMGFDRNKLLIELKNKTILQRTLEALKQSSCIDHFVLVIRKEDEEDIRQSILPNLFTDKNQISLVYGGKTREESTWHGLQAIPDQTDYVLYHDGARPFVSQEVVARTVQALEENDVDGAICVVPVKDTIKVINQKKMVETTPKRSNLVAVQTPQVFKKASILSAYEKALEEDVYTTDDSQIVELFGGKIITVQGDYENLKITTKDDLLMGELILDARKEEVER